LPDLRMKDRIFTKIRDMKLPDLKMTDQILTF